MKNRSDLQRQIDKIINDKTSGSTDLLVNLNTLLLKYFPDKNSADLIVSSTKKHLTQFNVITSYLQKIEYLQNVPDKLIKYLDEIAENAASPVHIYQNALPYIKHFSSVLTLSHSRTVINFLKLWKQDKPSLRVVVCESRPNLEGRKTCEELLRMKIKTELITDVSMAIFIPQTDAVLIGADRILKNGNVINKTGSLAAALLCKKYNKPFFVAAAPEKFSKISLFRLKEENPFEVWDKKSRYLKIRNYYFEEVDKKLITRIFI